MVVEFATKIAGGIATEIAVGIVGGIVDGIVGGIVGGITVGIAFTISYILSDLRIFYYPIHLFFSCQVWLEGGTGFIPLHGMICVASLSWVWTAYWYPMRNMPVYTAGKRSND